MITVHASVQGRVQGVGYRWFARDAATARGVAGWVRNRRDGSVEAVLQGTPDAVDRMLDDLRTGPAGARVTGLVTSALDSRVTMTGFEIRPTA